MTLIIHDCNVLTRSADGRYAVAPGQDILVQGNRIAAIQPTQPRELLPAGEVVEAHGLLATPGLINTHAHVPMVLFRGLAEDVSVNRWFNDFIWPVESNLTPEDVYWGMLLGLAEMIESGVTTVADHYFFMDDAARAVETAGSRALLGWAVFGSQGDDALAASADFVARWQGAANGRIRTWLAPHAPYTCDDDFLRATVAHARRLDVGIHIHAAEDPAQTASSLAKRGLTPIQVLEQTGILAGPTLIAHGCGILPADVALLRPYAEHVGVAHCPKTYLKLAAGLTPIFPLREAGVAIGLGTDGAASNNTLDIWESLRLMALTQKFTADDPEVMTAPRSPGHRLRGQRGGDRDGRPTGAVGARLPGRHPADRPGRRPPSATAQRHGQPGLQCAGVGRADGHHRWQGSHGEPAVAHAGQGGNHRRNTGTDGAPRPPHARAAHPGL